MDINNLKVGDLIPIGGSGNAKPNEVLEGKTFSSDDGTDLKGTMKNNGNKIITPSKNIQTLGNGFYNSLKVNPIDSNVLKNNFPELKPENIKNGVNIGGISGTYEDNKLKYFSKHITLDELSNMCNGKRKETPVGIIYEFDRDIIYTLDLPKVNFGADCSIDLQLVFDARGTNTINFNTQFIKLFLDKTSPYYAFNYNDDILKTEDDRITIKKHSTFCEYNNINFNDEIKLIVDIDNKQSQLHITLDYHWYNYHRDSTYIIKEGSIDINGYTF